MCAPYYVYDTLKQAHVMVHLKWLLNSLGTKYNKSKYVNNLRFLVIVVSVQLYFWHI